VSAVEQATDTIEYLLEEVLDVQTSEVRRFLLETSVADMLTTPLVVELCGPGAEHLLAGLPHLNTFAEPVPGQPGCFRYPPFFKALLQAQLAYEQPQRWLELHRRAAQWCLHEGLPDRALNHLSAIHAWREAARLLVSSGRVGPLLSEGALAGASWVVATRIPRDVSIPEACVVRAAVALADGDAHLCTVELAGARARMAGTGAPAGERPGPRGGARRRRGRVRGPLRQRAGRRAPRRSRRSDPRARPADDASRGKHGPGLSHGAVPGARSPPPR
jgi:LuxR family maltose regulon positive regulatory protein